MTTVQSTVHGGKHVVIIGGGIAGLAAALRVQALNSVHRVTIVDSVSRLGGKIAGEIVGGCVVDGGADVCIGGKLRATRLFADLGLGDRVIAVNPNALPTYEWRDGQLQRLPASFDGELLTFRQGMQELVDTVCEGLHDVTVVTDTAVNSVTNESGRWQVDAVGGASYIADAVIIATPASVAAALLAIISPDTTNGLTALQYPPTTTVTMAWNVADVPRPLDGTGYLVTDETARFSACTWTSSKTPSHAASGIALLRGYVRGVAGDAAALMHDEVATVLGITSLPRFTRIYEWPAGIPIYTPEYSAIIADLTDRLKAVPGIFIAGSAFHGVGIPDCITSGERAAAAAVSYFAASNTGGVA